MNTTKQRTIAVVSKSMTLAAAIQAALAPRHKDAQFVVVDKLTDAPEGSEFATLGLPAFVPGTEGVKVLSMGTRQAKDASERNGLWETLRDENSSEAECLAALGAPESYLILNGRTLAEIRVNLANHRVDISDAETPEDKVAKLTEAFNYLRGILG